MIQVYSDVYTYRGEHYSFGRKQAEELLDSLILPNRRKQWGKRMDRHFIIDMNEVKSAFIQFAPKIWEEIEGLADGLSLSVEEAVREFGGYYLEYGHSGCSIFTGNNYLIRNYDNDPITYEGRFLFYQPTDGGYATVGPTMQITGRTDGMNEKGLVLGYNFVNRRNSGNGFVCNMIGRIVLENCATVDEAIDLLKDIPHRHSFNYVLLDKSGKNCVVEASPRKVEVHQANVCTNHFRKLTEENRYQSVESMEREKLMLSRQEDVLTGYEAYQMLNDTRVGVFSKKYGAWAGTIHTAAYFPKEGKAWFALGGDQKPLILDFNKWLNGESLLIKKVKGTLETNKPFINMVKL